MRGRVCGRHQEHPTCADVSEGEASSHPGPRAQRAGRDGLFTDGEAEVQSLGGREGLPPPPGHPASEDEDRDGQPCRRRLGVCHSPWHPFTWRGPCVRTDRPCADTAPVDMLAARHVRC